MDGKIPSVAGFCISGDAALIVALGGDGNCHVTSDHAVYMAVEADIAVFGSGPGAAAERKSAWTFSLTALREFTLSGSVRVKAFVDPHRFAHKFSVVAADSSQLSVSSSTDAVARVPNIWCCCSNVAQVSFVRIVTESGVVIADDASAVLGLYMSTGEYCVTGIARIRIQSETPQAIRGFTSPTSTADIYS